MHLFPFKKENGADPFYCFKVEVMWHCNSVKPCGLKYVSHLSRYKPPSHKQSKFHKSHSTQLPEADTRTLNVDSLSATGFPALLLFPILYNIHHQFKLFTHNLLKPSISTSLSVLFFFSKIIIIIGHLYLCFAAISGLFPLFKISF